MRTRGAVDCESGPQLTGAMALLAWAVLNGDEERREAWARALAELILHADRDERGGGPMGYRGV